jgi:hypothetical protein
MQVVKELLQQLQDNMWTIPAYEKAKQNLLNREDVCRSIYGDTLFSDSSDSIKLMFDTDKGTCCYIENCQTLVHGRGIYQKNKIIFRF